MRSNELKFLANLAKQRLMNKNYDEKPVINKNKASSYFICNALALKKLKAETNYVTIKDSEDIEFINKVRDILDSDCYNPLGRLCDQEYFRTLDDRQKQFYILNLSEKYNKIKSELMIG
jgi:broad-specificity NMP kinase